jgi:hypothetical protein
MPTGKGSFFLYLHGIVRKASATQVGDRVQVQIAFDAAYKSGPQHPMPRWFSRALATRTAARENWKALIPSRKKEILRYFAGLKSAAARERNVRQALHVLSGNTDRFMARTWRNGS